METQKIPGNLHMLRIFPKTLEPTIGRPAIEVASSDAEEIVKWMKEIEAVCELIDTQQKDQYLKEAIMKKKAQSKKIALEMSNLVTYCRPVHFQFEREFVWNIWVGVAWEELMSRSKENYVGLYYLDIHVCII